MTRVPLISPVGAPAATTPEADGAGGYAWVAASVAGALAKLPIQAAVTASGNAVTNAHNQVDATSGTVSLALPAGQILGTLVNVEKIDSSTNAVTITGNIRGVGASSLSLALQHESVLFEADSSGSWWPIAGHKTLGSLDGRYVNLTSPDANIHKRIRISDTAIDLNRPWSDGVTNWAGVNPGDDITTRLQAAINFLLGVTTGQLGVAVTAAANCEIYFSQPGTYTIGTTVTSGTSGGNPYQGVILFPGVLSGIGASIKIRGLAKPVWSSAANQSGVIFRSACVGGEMFSVPGAGSGVYPSLSQICPQFENITFVNTADGGVFDFYSSGAYHLIDCLEVSSLAKGVGTRRAITSPHGIQHGDMVIKNLWVAGGYKTALGAAEHLVAYGWHAVVGVQNVIETYGSGAAIHIGGNLWFSNCDTLIWPSTSTPRIVIDRAVWEVGGSQAARLINDSTAALVGKVGLHLTSASPMPKLSLCGTAGSSNVSNGGTELDVESVMNEPGGWHTKHPVETFRRVLDPVASTDVPGFTSDTWHPWRVDAGAFTLARVDAGCGTTAGTPVVTDPSITANDLGRTVTGGGANILALGVYVGTVIPGVSFRLTNNPLIQHDVNADATGTVSLTIGVASGVNNGTLQNASNGTLARCVVPVKNGQYGGESRSITYYVNNPAGVYNTQITANRVMGTNGSAANGNSIAVVVGGGNILLQVPGSGNVATATGVVAASTSYAVTLNLIVDALGFVRRATVYLATSGGAPVRVADHLLTSTERATVGVGARFPFLEDGITISSTDTGSVITGFQVRPLSGDDNARRGATATYTATQGTLSPAGVDAGAATLHQITVNDAAPFTVPTPTDAPDTSMTQDLIVEVALAAQRTDASCGTTNTSPTVTDAAIVAGDVGRSITGTGIPANTFVGTVTPGVSFLLSSSPTSQVNVNATATNNPVSLVIGGTMGAVTFQTSGTLAFKMVGLTFTSPAQNKRRYARFAWNGLNWICTSVAPADY